MRRGSVIGKTFRFNRQCGGVGCLLRRYRRRPHPTRIVRMRMGKVVLLPDGVWMGSVVREGCMSGAALARPFFAYALELVVVPMKRFGMA